MNTMNQMKDKDLVNDLLMSEKLMCSTYNTAVTESATENIRTEFKNILNEELDIQNNIFSTMSQKGWYAPEAAESNKINQTASKFSQSQ